MQPSVVLGSRQHGPAHWGSVAPGHLLCTNCWARHSRPVHDVSSHTSLCHVATWSSFSEIKEEASSGEPPRRNKFGSTPAWLWGPVWPWLPGCPWTRRPLFLELRFPCQQTKNKAGLLREGLHGAAGAVWCSPELRASQELVWGPPNRPCPAFFLPRFRHKAGSSCPTHPGPSPSPLLIPQLCPGRDWSESGSGGGSRAVPISWAATCQGHRAGFVFPGLSHCLSACDEGQGKA